MDFRGVFQDGVIRPTAPVDLPNGTQVECHPISTPGPFWESRSVEDLAREQGTLPTRSLDDLRGDWPSDENVDEFLKEVREGRQ